MTTDASNAETPRRAKVVLVDDHPIVREGLARLIQQEPDLEVCAEAEDEPGALVEIRRHRPDLVIVDLSLKRGDGIDLIRQIHRQFPDLAVLVLSIFDEPHYMTRALRAGALGYLTKQEASEKVLVAIRKVLSGEVYLSESFAPILLKRLLSSSSETDETPVSALSDREIQVFQMIGAGMATQEIAERLHLSAKTIETYQARIRDKLGLKDSRKLIQYAIRWALGPGSKPDAP